jgi:hypothetical protein
VVSCAPEVAGEIEALADEVGVPLRRIGTVGGGTLLGVEVAALREAYESESRS